MTLGLLSIHFFICEINVEINKNDNNDLVVLL